MTETPGRRILVVGRGTAGRAIASDARARGGVVVGFLDDRDTSADVIGTLQDAATVIERESIDVVYFAIPSVDARTVREFVTSVANDDVEIAILPRTYSILAKDTVDIDDLTDVDVLDLVGRQPVKHDLLASRQFVAGKTVLVTGAAGSIGSRLFRQLVDLGVGTVVGVDWNESGIFFLGQELADRPGVHLHVADVRAGSVRRLFERYRPEIVFHAAAYKHVPLMQANPIEAINNNVGGTLGLMRLASEFGVSNFVYVSTDKAVNPVNVMGATKRIGEQVMECIAARSATRFNAVRFGNVIQSSGSVMQIFRNQISQGKPLTVTHPEVTRFFMTVDEASQLVIQSAFVGEPGELFVLDMGEPVRILDLARSLVKAVDPTLSIEITGLRPGEKMYEELSYEPDLVRPTANPKIFGVNDEAHVDRDTFLQQIDALLALTESYALTDEDAVARLRELGFAIQ